MADLEVVLKDFGEISRKAFELKDLERDAIEEDFESGLGYHMALIDYMFLDDLKLVWYDGREGSMPEVPVGNPEDYVAIRDDYEALKAFLAPILDRGKVEAGMGGHGDNTRDTNLADYVIWMHTYSEHKPFRENLEKAVVELLKENFDIPRKSYEEIDQEVSAEKIERARTRDLEEYKVADMRGVIKEMMQDWNERKADPSKELESFFKDGRNFWVIQKHMTEELDETAREALYQKLEDANWEYGRLETEVVDQLVDLELRSGLKYRQHDVRERYAQQHNRLLGLLDVIAANGKPDNGFSDSYPVLAERAREGFMKDAHDVEYSYSASNIYRSILIALASVQQGDGLQQFWLDSIRDDPSSQRVIVSVHGLLSIYGSKEEKRAAIPSVLERLQERGYDVDEEYTSHSPIGFYTNENLLNDILEHITGLCFSRDTYFHIDKEANALDFLNEKTVETASYTFSFSRYTPQGKKDIKVAFNVSEDSLEGDVELEGSVRAYLSDFGYEVPNEVFVTSLEGRRIQGTDAKLVDPDGNDIDGFYEGLIGLNHTLFPFIYDAEQEVLLVAEPVKSKSMMFGGGRGWEERRMGLDKVEEKVMYSRYRPLSRLGERVNELIDEKRKQRYLGDSLYSLQDRLTDELTPHIANVVSGRLIQQSDGLVK
ncbi:MAG: hypothetical protein KJ709_05960 [Nanoarchaeota archaeon]|nr:hypothetical protein [Nanoarchaeota archaeon]